MRQYELAFIVHPDLDETAFKDLLDRVQAWITDAGGKVTKVDLWGKKKLAYEIRKQKEGQYVLLYVDMAPSFLTELERNLGLLESVMRFMVIRPEEAPEPAPVQVSVPAEEPEPTPEPESEE